MIFERLNIIIQRPNLMLSTFHNHLVMILVEHQLSKQIIEIKRSKNLLRQLCKLLKYQR